MPSVAEPAFTKLSAPQELDLRGDSLVKVLVGDPNQPDEFQIHRKLICNASQVFNAALRDGSFKEGHEGIITLPTQAPTIFRSFSHWLYTQDLVTKAFKKETINNDMNHLIRLYVFADQYMIVSLRSQILGLMYDLLLSVGYTRKAVRFAYENTRPGSGLRKLLSEYVGRRANLKRLRTYRDKSLNGCPDLLMDVMLALTDRCEKTINYFVPSGTYKATYLAILEKHDPSPQARGKDDPLQASNIDTSTQEANEDVMNETAG